MLLHGQRLLVFTLIGSILTSARFYIQLHIDHGHWRGGPGAAEALAVPVSGLQLNGDRQGFGGPLKRRPPACRRPIRP
eukprot:1159343-Pelagomonas_calceolata.AAC.2